MYKRHSLQIHAICDGVKISRSLTTENSEKENEHFSSDNGYADFQQSFIRCGSVRGVRNGVKKTIGQLLVQRQWTRNYEEADRGKIVVYMTSMGVVRRTWERCRLAVAILENHCVNFERRDLGFSRALVDEFRNRMGDVNVLHEMPTVFVDGRYFGNVDTLENWSESGWLKHYLMPFKRSVGERRALCQKCYGFQYYPCSTCRGGKKSPTIVNVSPNTRDAVRLKCTQCDSGGLVACEDCVNGYVKP